MSSVNHQGIDQKYCWSLEDILPSDEAWEAEYARVSRLVDSFARLDGTVAADPRSAIRGYFELCRECSPVFVYAMLRLEENNNDPAAQLMTNRTTMLSVNLRTATGFLRPELLAMDDSVLQELQNDPDMADYNVFLKEVRTEKSHTLSKNGEHLLAMISDLEATPRSVYGALTSADMIFPDIVLKDGTHLPLTEGNFSRYRDSQDPDQRRQSFVGIMETYGRYGTTCAALYSANVRKDLFASQARRYGSCRAAAMEPLEIPERVYDNLIECVHEAIPSLNRYLALRRQLMKVDTLHMWDLYVPMVKDSEKPVSFEDAFDLVLEGLAPLGEDYRQLLIRAKNERWMDVYPCPGKSSGAFSEGALYGTHPYILLNHNDNIDGAFTMAHELGHSMHSWFSNHTQPYPKADYSLFVAEVASLCNEFLMMRTLLNRVTEPGERAYLLNYQLEQFRTTCFRQTMFAEFEKIAHEMCEHGEALTRETLSRMYMDLNRLYYGGVCEVDDCVKNEWMRIPHFYSSFYVYVYATGLCAACSISERILREGETAVRDYRRFLSAGASLPPIEALKLAGIDMASPEPIRSAMAVFSQTLDEFTALVNA